RANKSSEYKSKRSRPTHRATRGVKVDSKAKESKGMAVINPTKTCVRRSCSVISIITGPTEVMGARKLAAIKMTPAIITATSNFVFGTVVIKRYQLLLNERSLRYYVESNNIPLPYFQDSSLFLPFSSSDVPRF